MNDVMRSSVIIAAAGLTVMAFSVAPPADPAALLRQAVAALRPLCKPVPKPGAADWLANHPEPGQTFEKYLKCDPVTLKGKRHVIYVQPIGSFSPNQRKVLDTTAKYLGVFYHGRVVMQVALSASVVPAEARRLGPAWGNEQILTTFVLNKVLKPRLPQDAAAFLGFTPTDLWPGEGWNFVFGQATLRDRVGVWSLYQHF